MTNIRLVMSVLVLGLFTTPAIAADPLLPRPNSNKPNDVYSTSRHTMTDILRTGHIDGVPEPTGPWSWTVSSNGLVFVSGVRGIDPATGRPAESDARRLELIFHHLGRILDQAGSSFGLVLSSTVYVTDMARLRPLVNDAYIEAFGDHRPTRTIVEVAALNQDDSVEIEVIAAQGR